MSPLSAQPRGQRWRPERRGSFSLLRLSLQMNASRKAWSSTIRWSVALRVGVRYRLEPGRHDRNGVDGITGEEQRHDEDLPNPHEALTCLDQTGNDEREGGKAGGSQQHEEDYPQQCQWLPGELHSKKEGQQGNDDRL